MTRITINGRDIEVNDGLSILDASRKIDIDIPTLCHMEELEASGACRICVVEVEGARNLVPSCATKVSEGMIIKTHSDRVMEARRTLLKLILANHKVDCFSCEKTGKCKLQDYCYEYGIDESMSVTRNTVYPIDDSNPFYYFDRNKCILCRKCLRVCSELQCTSAICVSERGYDTHVTAPFEEKIQESSCVSCGNCVSNCPVGALMPKTKEKFRTWEIKFTKTICPYCGVGCEMYLVTKGNKVVSVEPAKGAANNGLLCVKGKFAYGFINHTDRLSKPLIKKEGNLVEATWEEAYEFIADKIKEIKQNYGPQAFAGLASARCTNEENYLFQKMFRAVIGTNNIDHCARLCHASTVAGLAITLGSGAMTNSIEEIVNEDVIFITGSNTTETHPVIGAKIRQARLRGAKLIVAEPRKIDLAKDAEIFLQIKPGTNVALFNGMMNIIIDEGLEDKGFIESRTENYEELVKVVKNYTPEKVAKICGIDAEDLKNASRLYAKAEKVGIFYSMGVTQHSTGTQGVMSVSNLALLCGNVGKESSGVNPLRGQNNVQGACDLGALPGDLPGYQKVFIPEVIEKFEDAWKVKLSDKPGLTVTEMLNEAEKKKIKFMYIMGENPMISDPDTRHVKKALEALDFLVVQDIFLTETAALADVVLPAVSFAEKDGTFTNTERRVQRVRRAIKPLGEAKEDWRILSDLMNKLGCENDYEGPSKIMEEISMVTPIYGGISYERLEESSLQWPCPTKDHPGTKFLHVGKFSRGKGLFKPSEYIESAEMPNKEYPYLMTTGRILYHYHTRTMTGKIEGIEKIAGESYIEINSSTANKLGLEDGCKVRVCSKRGEIITKAKVTDIIEDDVVFMPFHYAEGSANMLTNAVVDPIAKIPELKVCAVNIEKI